MFRLLIGLICCVCITLSGCGKKKPVKSANEPKPSTPRAAVKLTVLVVDDPEIATGINLLRGEWAERSGGQLKVEECSSQELLADEELSCDVIIYPSRYLGTLVEREALRPVRQSILQDEQFNFSDILPLIRNRVLRYGGEIYALSLGEPPLMLAWDGEVPVEENEGQSILWSECDRLSRARGKDSNLKKIKDSWAVELIVRAVGYSSRQSDTALLFDPQTLEPRLSEPPFVRALHDMVLLEQRENSDEDGSSIRLSWPTAIPATTSAANSGSSANSEDESVVSFFAVPLADEMYDRGLGIWNSDEETNESPTCLGFAGRMASVSRSSRNAASAFKLLKWLTSGYTATQVSRRSDATLWFRESQISQSNKWLRGRNVSDGVSLIATRLLSGENAYLLPRIPGIDEYLESLDKVVASVLLGDLDEEEALGAVAASWQAITESYGRERQRQAYRRHLGFNDQ